MKLDSGKNKITHTVVAMAIGHEYGRTVSKVMIGSLPASRFGGNCLSKRGQLGVSFQYLGE